jgi:hypothetical protein
LCVDQADGRLDLGCIAAYGTFGCEGADCRSAAPHDKATTSFLLEIITRLQGIGTAPAIDMAAYAQWLISSEKMLSPASGDSPAEGPAENVSG